MIKAIISDMGQVVLWFDNGQFYRRLSQVSPLSQEEIRQIVRDHFELIELLDTGRISPPEFYTKIISLTQANLSYEDFIEAYCNVFSPNYQVINILKRAKTSCRLILLSNTDLLRFSYIRERFPEAMIFDSLVLSYEVGLMKPHPEIYRIALDVAQVSPGEAVFIDDLEENIRTANLLGLKSILYRPETELEKALSSFGINLVSP
ncbi:MAG: HAD family phosphatase [Candidatus Aminicenantes bacterium]|nr:HAD family phosphatase [Candidatus Aminicenantes bacterium]